MKWTIEGFSQAEALNFQKEILDKKTKQSKLIKIDCIDLIILRWFVDFFPKMRKIEVDGTQYAWVNYKELLADLPLLNIGKQMLSLRFKKLSEFDVLERYTLKEGGTFSYYKFGENYERLISKEGTYNNSEGCVKNYIGVHNKLYTPNENIIEQINPSTIYSSTKDSSTIYNDEFEQLWNEYPRKQGKSVALKAYIKARKNGVDKDTILTGIKNYVNSINQNKTERKYIKQGSTWFNQECWNDEYNVKPRRDDLDDILR